MKLNDKQRKTIVMIIYILLIMFFCYCEYAFPFSHLTSIIIITVGVVGLFICQKIYPRENMVKSYNTESEMHILDYWNMNNCLEKLESKYTLYYEEVLKDSTDVTIRKYLKVNGIYSFTKNKTLVVIEAPKVTLDVVELIYKIKKEFKENIPKLNFFNSFYIYRLDILIVTEDMDEDLLQYINSEIVSTNETKGSIKAFLSPIVINKRYNKLYISGFNDDSFSGIVYFAGERQKIRKKLKKYKII